MKAILLAPFILSAGALAQDDVPRWPSFRGIGANGIGEGIAPTEWDVETGENIRWKVEIPGFSLSSPIAWDDKIFLTTAVKDGEAELQVGLFGSVTSVEDDSEHEFRVLCLDRSSGEILWQKTSWTGVPAIKRHPKGSHAASTPATDGTHVVAFFASEGLYCYDFDGELRWKKDFGVLDSGWFQSPGAQWGYAASPVIHEGRIYIQCDVQENSFVGCFDVMTGDEIWRTKREDVPTWCTPAVHIGEDRRQLILNGYRHIGGYDLDTGKELWKLEGGGDIPVPTPIFSEDLVFITNAHGRQSPIYAISVEAEGDLFAGRSASDESHEAIAWSIDRGGNYMQTPLAYDDLLFACRDNGSLSCFDAQTGDRHYRQRIGPGHTGFTASPVAVGGKLYFTSELGEVYVVEASAEFNLLAENELGEQALASPAVVDGTIYFRTKKHLIAVGGD